ncbi:hypothetical protein KL86DYS1_31303 [uncultured Dysgonomonas sp.]|uniref:Uncharacterized protein n=1 Tax=uncultured Dysgonomonas sp. TaxID=206096 RepID=A0A212K387_9BACT|nr:hypothetical protein KL86DYS1_31303 [uncultured Dysgonomonas sp.]
MRCSKSGIRAAISEKTYSPIIYYLLLNKLEYEKKDIKYFNYCFKPVIRDFPHLFAGSR